MPIAPKHPKQKSAGPAVGANVCSNPAVADALAGLACVLARAAAREQFHVAGDPLPNEQLAAKALGADGTDNAAAPTRRMGKP